MSVDNALIKVPKQEIVKFDEKMFDKISGSTFLPRLQLMTAASDACKSGSFPINHYALIRGQSNEDVGAAVDVLVVGWRPEALEIGEQVISCFDVADPEFARIQARTEEPNSGCMFGPEFLIFIPIAKSFATFFMGSKSSRREAPAIKARMQKAATLKSQEIKTKKYTWYSPVVTPCTTPFDLPNMDDIATELEKFNNPPKVEIEHVEEGTGRDR